MSRFVPNEPIPVHTEDDTANVIYVRPRMDVGTQSLVQSAMVSIQSQANTTGAAIDRQALKIDVGAYNVALLTHNIMRWSGPDFDGLPCNAENIKRLDPDDPLLALVLQEINKRNLTKVASPNLSAAPGKNDLTPNGAHVPQDENLETMSQLVSTTTT